MLVAVRHAPLLAAGICVGAGEAPVLLTHDETARVICRHVEGLALAVVWSSPLERCAAPAALAAAALGVPHRIDPRLREISLGRWERERWSEIASREPEALAAWGERWQSEPPPGGEPLDLFEARVRQWWTDCSASAVLVAHAGVVRALRVIAAGATWPRAMELEVPPLAAERFPLPPGRAGERPLHT